MKTALQNAMKAALKNKERVKLDTVRLLLSAIQYEEMQREVEELTDEAALQVVQRELKKRREELEFAEKASRPDLKDKLHCEIAAIEEFLPKQLSNDELEMIIANIRSQNPAINMGGVMKSLQEQHPGCYNSRVASEIAKRVLVG